MREDPGYAILGRGQWALRIQSILETERRGVTCIANTRRDLSETEESYGARLASALRGSGAQIAWLCVTPGPHVVCMIKAAIDVGVHPIAEKPWLVSASETEELAGLATRRGIALGVHFEYCLLDEIEKWRERFHDARGLQFGGRFTTSRPDRLGISAAMNLGCHLLAMRRYAVPSSEIAELSCAYESDDERRVWIGNYSVDFTYNRQPIIQRFMHRFEAAIEGAEFPFGIEFGLRVAQDLLKYPVPQTAASQRP
jgi:predicted dehydrogenase